MRNVNANGKSGVIDVFISYSSADEQIANMVVEGLSERGVNCWKAGTYTINSGDDFREKIAQALDECKIFLIILSKHSMSTPWVRIELTEALRKNKKIYSLRIDDSPLDELFEFKLGCSQISDGTRNLVPVLENLSMNIKKDRDALLEKEKSSIYSQAKGYRLFNFSLINRLFFLFPLLMTIWRVIYVVNNPVSYEDTFFRVMDELSSLFLMLLIYIFVHAYYRSNLKKYAELGCTSAEYLTFKRFFHPLSSKAKKQKGLVYLQRAAHGGDHRALFTLSKFLSQGKHVKKDETLAKEYLELAQKERKRLFSKIKQNKVSFIVNIFLTLFLLAVYVYGFLLISI